MRAGDKIKAGAGNSTILADLDFETYSEAGYYFDPARDRWRGVTQTAPGLPAVGASVYTEHPSAEIICMAYDLKDGKGPRLWVPGAPDPQDLLDHVAAGGLIEAHNSGFEFYVWNNIATRRHGWPALPVRSLRCSAAKARAFSLPGALDKVGAVLEVEDEKLKEGKALIRKFSIPRSPTKKDRRLRNMPGDEPEAAARFYNYCMGDIRTESQVSAKLPDLEGSELDLWLLDQEINTGGVYIDLPAVDACLSLVDEHSARLTSELQEITGGGVGGPGEVAKILKYCAGRGIRLASLDKEAVEHCLGRDDIPADVRRVLEIRSSLGAASVKKLGAIRRRVSADGRLRDMFAFCGADRTGRWAGRGPQPQNLPNSGPLMARCNHCGHVVAAGVAERCPSCGEGQLHAEEWDAEPFLDFVASGPTYDEVRAAWPDVLAPISGSLRGLFSAAPGHDFICSDYSAIEAVVLAALAGEEWRLEVFRTHGKIYEMSAAKISGVPFEEFLRHKETTGDHHPLRKKIGKVAELASGYQGGYNAWLAFGADKHLEEQEIRDAIKAWRKGSPAIVNFWYRVEELAIAAVQAPGARFEYRGMYFGVIDDVLYIRLLSGRLLKYHEPRIKNGTTPWGAPALKLTFMGLDSFTKKWTRLSTYGGKLTENIVQATSRDILAHALLKTNAAGYRPVLHIHDEIVAEVPEGAGSIEEFETLMADLPSWCSDWPVRAAGGWRGKRYKKD